LFLDSNEQQLNGSSMQLEVFYSLYSFRWISVKQKRIDLISRG
jgi:hypothetical protein